MSINLGKSPQIWRNCVIAGKYMCNFGSMYRSIFIFPAATIDKKVDYFIYQQSASIYYFMNMQKCGFTF